MTLADEITWFAEGGWRIIATLLAALACAITLALYLDHRDAP